MSDERLRDRLWGGNRADSYRRGRLLTGVGFLVFMLGRLAGATGGWISTAVLVVAAVIVVFGAMELWNWRSLPDGTPSAT